jgi:hypothetical protein
MEKQQALLQSLRKSRGKRFGVIIEERPNYKGA